MVDEVLGLGLLARVAVEAEYGLVERLLQLVLNAGGVLVVLPHQGNKDVDEQHEELAVRRGAGGLQGAIV